jgi:hypothetical protein
MMFASRLQHYGLAVASEPLATYTFRRFLLRKFALFAVIVTFSLLPSLASAQQGDAMIGFSTIMDPTSSSSSSCPIFSTTCLGPEKGGLYATISGDVIFHKRLGFNIEANWRAKQGLDLANGGQLYRPILFDFNGDYQPRISKKLGADLLGGIGWQTTRFYGYNYSSNCLVFGSCYTSNDHFLLHFGGGIRYYAFGGLFIRPEVHYYHVLNNTDVFTNTNILRVGASIGYTIGGPNN